MGTGMGIKKATLINSLGKYSKVILSVIVNAILARILSPDDYGIVAVITVFSTLFMTLSDMGFGAAIVQCKELSQKDIDSIYSLTVYIALFLSIGFVVLAFPISWFYKNEAYIYLGILLSIAVFFNAVNMVPNGILSRDKKFVLIAFRTVIVYIVASVVAIGLAKLGFKYYSLAIQTILTAIATFICNYRTTRPHFSFSFRKESINKVLSYSGYQFSFNIVNYFSRNLDHLLTGKVLGDAALGYYDKAYTLMLYPVNNLSGVLSPVLHPVLSEYQKDKKVIYDKFCKIVRLLACVGIYIAVICFFSAHEIVSIMYGLQWQETVGCFQFFSIAIVPQMINSSMGAVYQSIGNTKLLFQNSCINTTVTVVAIIIGLFGGGRIGQLAVCVAIAYIVHFVTASYMLVSLGFGYNFITYFKQFIPEIVITICMIVGTLFYPFDILNPLGSLVVKCVYVGTIYVIILWITKEYKILKSFIK